MHRVVVFFDHQNVYRFAREAFFEHDVAPPSRGQYWPDSVAAYIVGNHRDNLSLATVEARVYCGLPTSWAQPTGHKARSRQISAWESRGINVVARPLRYPKGWGRHNPQQRHALGMKPQEKGVDVALAVDLVALAVRGSYDIGIVFSGDTDLLPAIDYVRGEGLATIEVASWQAPTGQQRAIRAKPPIWCHYLHRNVYDATEDTTDYTA